MGCSLGLQARGCRNGVLMGSASKRVQDCSPFRPQRGLNLAEVRM